MVKTCSECGGLKCDPGEMFAGVACSCEVEPGSSQAQGGTCASCRHWTQNECHCHAPQPAVVLDESHKLAGAFVVLQSSVTAFWPSTMPEDRCGEWAARGVAIEKQP